MNRLYQRNNYRRPAFCWIFYCHKFIIFDIHTIKDYFLFIMNLYAAVNPFTKLSLLFGISILKITKSKIPPMKLEKHCLLITAMYTTMYLYFSWRGSHVLSNEFLRFNYGILFFGTFFIFAGHILLIVTAFGMNKLISASVYTFLLNIERIDIIFKHIDIQVNYKNFYMYQIIILTLGSIFLWILAPLGHFINYKKRDFEHCIITIFALFFPSAIKFYSECQFVFLVKLLHEKLSAVSNLLEKMLSHFSQQISFRSTYPSKRKFSQGK